MESCGGESARLRFPLVIVLKSDAGTLWTLVEARGLGVVTSPMEPP